MLKKIIVSAFVGLVLVAPMSASAIGNELARDVKSSLSVENGTVNKKEFLVQVTSANNGEERSTVSQPQAADESEPILPTGWLLTMALLGFVMLSNRSGV